MEQTVSERAGIRLKKLRIALGFSKRPEFAREIGLTQGRLNNVENLNMRMNEVDFEAIGRRYPWALEYVAVGGDLVIPDDVDAPVKVISDAAEKTAAAAPVSLDPAELMKAMTTDPEMKAAFQKMMVEILQQGLNSDGN